MGGVVSRNKIIFKRSERNEILISFPSKRRKYKVDNAVFSSEASEMKF